MEDLPVGGPHMEQQNRREVSGKSSRSTSSAASTSADLFEATVPFSSPLDVMALLSPEGRHALREMQHGGLRVMLEVRRCTAALPEPDSAALEGDAASTSTTASFGWCLAILSYREDEVLAAASVAQQLLRQELPVINSPSQQPHGYRTTTIALAPPLETLTEVQPGTRGVITAGEDVEGSCVAAPSCGGCETLDFTHRPPSAMQPAEPIASVATAAIVAAPAPPAHPRLGLESEVKGPSEVEAADRCSDASSQPLTTAIAAATPPPPPIGTASNRAPSLPHPHGDSVMSEDGAAGVAHAQRPVTAALPATTQPSGTREMVRPPRPKSEETCGSGTCSVM